jgi:phosphoserine aminotransferase
MKGPVRLAFALWAVFAIVIFNVMFDWQSRTAGLAFIEAQTYRHALLQPIVTIEDGYRPLVAAAAWRSAMWATAVMAAAAAVILAASRRQTAE